MLGTLFLRRPMGMALPQKVGRTWPAAMVAVVLGVVLACALYAPASWLAHGVQRASQGMVRLLNPQGSLWQGSAALVLAAGPGGDGAALALPSRLSWRVVPDRQGLRVHLMADCCMPQALELQLGWDGVQVAQGQMALPLELLQGLGAPWNTLGIRGQLALQWKEARLSWREGSVRMHGQIDAEATGVSTRLTTLPAIGSYRVSLHAAGGPLGVQLSTLQGDLVLRGAGHWQGSHLQFHGEGQARGDSAPALVNLLSLLGERRGNTTRIRWG